MAQDRDDDAWMGTRLGAGLSPDAARLAREFTELARKGQALDVEAWLAQCPDQAERLRPVLEGAALFCAEVRRFRQALPDLPIVELFCGGRKGRGNGEVRIEKREGRTAGGE